MHGAGKPVTNDPGLAPTFPVSVETPVQVTVVEPKTAKLAAEPRDGACARTRLPILSTQIPNNSFFIRKLAFSVMSLTVREGSVGSDPGTKLADASNEADRVSVRFRTYLNELTVNRQLSANHVKLFLWAGVSSLEHLNAVVGVGDGI